MYKARRLEHKAKAEKCQVIRLLAGAAQGGHDR